MTNILYDDYPIIIPRPLVKTFGYNRAAFIQKLHWWLQKATYEFEDKKWVYKTFDEWSEELALTNRTIKRLVDDLKKKKIVLVNRFNKLKMDKTNWYSLNYEKLYFTVGQNGTSIVTDCHSPLGKSVTLHSDNLSLPIPYIQHINNINNNVELSDVDIVVKSVIEHLNTVANKRFSTTTKESRRLIVHWLEQGYTLDDFIQVIDLKTKEWLNSTKFNKYLRPITLFRKGNFENYVNELPPKKQYTDTNNHMTYEQQMQSLYGDNWAEVVDSE